MERRTVREKEKDNVRESKEREKERKNERETKKTERE